MPAGVAAAGPRRAPAPRRATISSSRSRNHGSKPAICVDPLDREALAQRLGGDQQPVGRRPRQRALDLGRVGILELAHPVEPAQPDLQPAQRLLQALGEAAADRHHLADRLHRRRQQRLGALELLEREARDLGHDIIDRRLEARRGRAAGDVVGDLVERVADRQPRRDLGDREAGRLRRQRRGPRHARVHLDHDHPPGLRIDCELDVGTACFDADFAQHRDRCRAHALIFLVGQGQRRGDGDASRRYAPPSGRYSRSSR